jgi:succinyl-diaminopimelate desuccinylase
VQDEILELAKKLIVIPSTKDNPTELEEVLNLAEKELSTYKIEEFKQNNISSILVYNTVQRPKKFKVILNAHLDVVPAKDQDYQFIKKGSKMFGRGSIDMKAAAAVEILVFKELANQLNYPLGLQVVTDEETGGFNGTKYQIEQGVRADFIIAGEHTNFGINNKAKGIVWLKIKSTGKSGHAAYPWLGVNALIEMNKFLAKLYKVFPTPKKESWKTTINLAKIETSNETFNKIPDETTAWLDIRFIPENKTVLLKTIKSIMPKNFEMEILEQESEHIVNDSNPYVKQLRESTKKITGKTSPLIVKHGGSDVRHYTQVGNNGVTFGPIGLGLHSDEEWVDTKSLSDYYQILKTFLLSLN